MPNENQFWFGNLRYANWYKAPDQGMDASSIGRVESETLANGGAFASMSAGSHRRFDMSWSIGEYDELRFLNKFRSGLYGSGLLYFADPFAGNVLPPHWATPMLCANSEWPSLIRTGAPPTVADTAANSYDQPYLTTSWLIETAVGTIPNKKLVLLIPPTKTLHIGFSGTATGSAVMRVQPVLLNGTNAATVNMTLLSATGATRMNHSFSGATYKAVIIYMTTTAVGQSILNLTSGKAVYSDTGITPTLTGNHEDGQGHSGLRFANNPVMTYIRAAEGKKQVSAAAVFEEVGSWL